MRMHMVLVMGLAAFGGALSASAQAADCTAGSTEEKIACLNSAVEALTKQLAAKANDSETVKWNDRVAIRNEDMRIYPRCLDNPGPNSPSLADVFASSCARVPAQTWMLIKP
jgi:hypothetical protein